MSKKIKEGSKCLKCGEKVISKLTRHHVYPYCHYGNGKKVILCRECHQELEKIILKLEGSGHKARRVKKEEWFYLEVLNYYLFKERD